MVGKVMFGLTETQVANGEKVVKDGIARYRVPLMMRVNLNDDSGHLIFRVMQNGVEIGRAVVQLDE